VTGYRLAPALGVVLGATASAAQQTATVAGRVVDRVSQAGIPQAEVLLAPGARRALTDAAGHFQLEFVAAGDVTLLVRRLGFKPESASFPVAANDVLEVHIELDASAQPLDTVTIAGRENLLARGKLAGFYERKERGGGRFFDSEFLTQNSHRRLGDVITANATGSRLIRSLTGNMAWIATTRRFGTSLIPGRLNIDEYDLNRGADPRACYPDVYLDGGVVYSFGRGNALFDINSIPTADLSAVEFYVGPSQIPLQYNKTSSVCGVLLIWTK
jgi:hypothetical protein